VVRIETEKGDILVAVDTVHAPLTSANFLRYVDGGYYSGGTVFRTVRLDNQPADSIRIEVIQGGADPARRSDFFDPIPLERTRVTGLRHVDGAISMARAGPDTATDSFFICIGDMPELDFGGKRNPDGQGFAAFGIVLEGMDVVHAIHEAASDGQSLIPPVAIRNITRE
jgi:peptidyl-prolyl cis-trans isomerase A (cyclophilin A)